MGTTSNCMPILVLVLGMIESCSFQYKERNFDTSKAFPSSCSQVPFAMTRKNQKLVNHNQNVLRKFLFLVLSANYLSTDKELKNSVSDVTF